MSSINHEWQENETEKKKELRQATNPPPQKKQKQNKINKLIKLNGWGTLNWLLGKTKPRQQLQGQHGPQSICLRNGTEGRKE